MNTWGAKSKDVRRTLHPNLRLLMDHVLREYDITLVQGLRGSAEQEAYFVSKRSKVRFPNSKHNRTLDPALPSTVSPMDFSDAVDIVPAGIGYNATDAQLEAVAEVVFRCAEKLGLKVRWGGDFNMDGKLTTNDAWDAYHYELLWK